MQVDAGSGGALPDDAYTMVHTQSLEAGSVVCRPEIKRYLRSLAQYIH